VSEVGYAAALLLAAVFGWAGLAKFRAREQTARTFRAFGLAAPDALAVGVPVTELVLAVGLVVVPGWAALGALAVLAGFSTILVRAMRAGVDVGCGCFGTAKREPVSFVELVRNGLLGVPAVAAAFAQRPDLPGLDDVILVSTAAAVGALVIALAELRRRTGHVWDMDLRP
jgi:uncharacterized membrane protein YphA (DoxX/SURF4 family)